MSDRRISDAEALDKLASIHLGPMAYDNPSSTLENIEMIVTDTGRTVEGYEDD